MLATVTPRPTFIPLVLRHRALTAILLGAFVLRLAWLLHAQPEPVSDYQVHVRLAENLLDERFFGIDGSSGLWLPGYPVFLAALMLVSRSTFWLSMVMVVLSTVVCLLVYLLALRLTHRDRVALVAALACAVSPTAVLYSPILGTEHLFVVLLLASLLLTLSINRDAPLLGIAAGAATGLAVLTRGEMVFYVPVLVALIWFASRIPSRGTRVRMIALLLGAIVVVVAPWVARNAVVIQPGLNLSTVGGMNFYFGHRPDGYGFTTNVPWPAGDDLSAGRLGWELGLAHIRDRPISLLESARDGTYSMLGVPDYALIWSTSRPIPGAFLQWEPRHVPFQGVIGKILEASAALLLVLSAVAFLTWRSWHLPLRIVMTGLILLTWLGHAVLFFGHPRFRYSVETVALILVAITLVTLWRGGEQSQATEQAMR
jgi:4-amino-4-deoxy-L-arabinose transferase-like glycosyltransferase